MKDPQSTSLMESYSRSSVLCLPSTELRFRYTAFHILKQINHIMCVLWKRLRLRPITRFLGRQNYLLLLFNLMLAWCRWKTVFLLLDNIGLIRPYLLIYSSKYVYFSKETNNVSKASSRQTVLCVLSFKSSLNLRWHKVYVVSVDWYSTNAHTAHSALRRSHRL